MKKIVSVVFGLVILGVLGIQLVPVDRSNPKVTMEIPAPDHVRDILRASCYDCHSNDTVWPWYSYVAPISWRVAGHVEHGREHVNFSEWDKYDARQRAHIIEECVEEVEKGKMPLDDYLRMHPDAKLNSQQIEALKTWASLSAMAGTVEVIELDEPMQPVDPEHRGGHDEDDDD